MWGNIPIHGLKHEEPAGQFGKWPSGVRPFHQSSYYRFIKRVLYFCPFCSVFVLVPAISMACGIVLFSFTIFGGQVNQCESPSTRTTSAGKRRML